MKEIRSAIATANDCASAARRLRLLAKQAHGRAMRDHPTGYYHELALLHARADIARAVLEEQLEIRFRALNEDDRAVLAERCDQLISDNQGLREALSRSQEETAHIFNDYERVKQALSDLEKKDKP